MRAFADDVWRCASGPTDTNAHLAVELADWWRQEPPTFEVYEVQEQAAPYPPYLTIGSPAILGGESFGANGSDVVLVEAKTNAA